MTTSYNFVCDDTLLILITYHRSVEATIHTFVTLVIEHKSQATDPSHNFVSLGH